MPGQSASLHRVVLQNFLKGPVGSLSDLKQSLPDRCGEIRNLPFRHKHGLNVRTHHLFHAADRRIAQQYIRIESTRFPIWVKAAPLKRNVRTDGKSIRGGSLLRSIAR